MHWLLAVHLGATLFMVGLIWFVQVVHYPLMRHVGAEGFVHYERGHQRLTTWVVAPAMLLEGVTALALLVGQPAGIHGVLAWSGLALLGVAWASTAWIQVPLHRLLGSGFDERVHRQLVRSNWLRTVAWSVRGGLVLAAAMMVVTPV